MTEAGYTLRTYAKRYNESYSWPLSLSLLVHIDKFWTTHTFKSTVTSIPQMALWIRTHLTRLEHFGQIHRMRWSTAAQHICYRCCCLRSCRSFSPQITRFRSTMIASWWSVYNIRRWRNICRLASRFLDFVQTEFLTISFNRSNTSWKIMGASAHINIILGRIRRA